MTPESLRPAASCIVLLAAALGLSAPAAGQTENDTWKTFDVAAGKVRAETIASDLRYPWSLVFLPDGSMLVSEKHPGRLRRVARDGTVSPPIEGLPPIFAEGNGGLLGLAIDPAFTDNNRIYFAYSEPGEGRKAGLSVGRAVLGENRLTAVETIFRQEPKVEDIRNFGGRLTFAPDGTLYVMTGDRFQRDLVQDLTTTIGKIVRIETDGDAPPDNPFVGRNDALPVIWSTGHRNMEGSALHPETRQLWIHELGPWGGDELNVPAKGANHGWPLVSWGRHYSGEDIPDPPTRPDLAASIFHWNPVISPSGMAFYNGDAIPPWKGNLLVGGLSSTDLVRLTLRQDRVISQERIDVGARVRDVAAGPDGGLYLLTDQPEGEIVRLTLAEPAAGD